MKYDTSHNIFKKLYLKASVSVKEFSICDISIDGNFLIHAALIISEIFF